MIWIMGSLLVSVAVLFFCILLIGGRNPAPSRWFSDTVVASVYVPLMCCLALGGLGAIVHAAINWKNRPPTAMESLVSLGILGSAGVGVKLMGVGKRLKRHEQKRKILEIVELAHQRRAGRDSTLPPRSSPERPKKAA